MSDVLTEKYHYSKEKAQSIDDFLTPMLKLEPEKRANAGGMASHEFLEGTKGMEGIKIDGVSVGSRGEGIEGWATEVKKR